ncbi:Bicupin, oxalate decarboxylase/oxidase [Peziza echinospora]|nr:Bicupin, oxalate decarboxylase/oxidase [Peziza echinospora]
MKPLAAILLPLLLLQSLVLAAPHAGETITTSSDGGGGPLAERTVTTKHLRPERDEEPAPLLARRNTENPQPVFGNKGAPILGGTNPEIDRQEKHGFVAPGTDNGPVRNLKWSFSHSKMRLFDGGWARSQTVQDLPPSKEISAVQQHIVGGAVRELHWHKVAEWGIVFNGSILLSAVDENGKNTAFTANQWDIWYFPKGIAHAVQGLAPQSEFLLVFDDGDFDAAGVTFNIVDWLIHTPRDVLARNFGVPEAAFDGLAQKTPFILPGRVPETEEGKRAPESPNGEIAGAGGFLYPLGTIGQPEVPGGGGTLAVIDSRNFPIAKTIAATVVTVRPGGLRELHWHPNADEWLYFHAGHARATVFVGSGLARTFDFSAGDTAVFPDNSGHYIENVSATEDLVWIEIYRSDRAVDISLTQWLALTPPDIVAQSLNVSREFVEKLSREKKIILK